MRQVFGERARTLGYAPRRGESDDDQLLRRSVIRFVAPEDPTLSAEARRLAVAWIGDRKAIDPGMVDSVMIVAAQTGDARTFDALLAEAGATSDGLDRRNLMVALLSFTDPALARRGMGVMLDPAFDIRESGTALWISSYSIPPRRETHEFIAANFDAMAKRVSRDAPGQLARLCRRPVQREGSRRRRVVLARSHCELCRRRANAEAERWSRSTCAAGLRAAQQAAVAAFLAKQ